MVSFPPAKLNLGLTFWENVLTDFTNSRASSCPLTGQTCWRWCLRRMFPKVKRPSPGLDCQSGDPENNLVFVHTDSWRSDMPCTGVHPPSQGVAHGGGVGGGSADGTYTLRALNEVCGLGLSQRDLMALAAELGSDCPFFVQDGPALVQGRGEVVKPLPFKLPLEGWWAVVANPGIHIGTAEAFADLSPTPRTTTWESLGTSPVDAWT